jgi:hypothetical protein
MSEYNSGVLGALDNPSSFPRNPDVLAEGLTGLTYGAGLPVPQGLMDLDTGGPAFNGRYVMGESNYGPDGIVQQTNPIITRKYMQDAYRWTRGDTFQDLPVFGLKPPTTAMRIDPVNVSYELYSISQLNWNLRYNPQWRKKFGCKTQGCDVLQEIRFLGVQVSAQSALNSNPSGNRSDAITVTLGGRARIPNIWLAQSKGGVVAEGASVGFLLRRYRYKGDVAASAMEWNSDLGVMTNKQGTKRVAGEPPHLSKRVRQDPFDSDSEEEEEEEKKHETTRAKGTKRHVWDLPTMLEAESTIFSRMFGDTVKLNETGSVDDTDDAEYYWSFDPYSAADQRSPPIALLRGGPDNPFCGSYLHLGMVQHVLKGKQERTRRQVDLARETLYPLTKGDAYIRSLAQLDTIEVQVGIMYRG